MEGAGSNWQRSECHALPPGWVREVVVRSAENALKYGKRSDVYYRSPSGKRVRSKLELVKLLGDTVDLTFFEWGTGTINPNLLQPKNKKSRDENSIEEPQKLPGTTPPPIKLPKENSFSPGAPVKLPKDWRTKSGQTPLPAPAPVKLPKDWREKSDKHPPVKISKGASPALAPVKLASNLPTKLPKDWKEKLIGG